MKTEKNLLHLIFAIIIVFTVSCAGITDANLTEVKDSERIQIESADLQAQDDVFMDQDEQQGSIVHENMIRIRPE